MRWDGHLTRRGNLIIGWSTFVLKKVNTLCLHILFSANIITYRPRKSKLQQPLRITTGYGLRTFSYIGSHLWNSVLNDHVDIAHIDCNEFKAFVNKWKAPDIFQYSMPLLWWSLHVFFYLMIVYLNIALYIFAPYSRILPFWLMLFVFHTT